MPEVQYNVICENVTKIYDLNRSRKDKLLSLFTFGKSYQFKPYYALKDVSFKVERGTSVGIIGLNGSGKSTLSNILGQVVMPTYGKVNTDGKP
ncbi:TPA: ATP-binding cassette domain-containing protein, partial [Staphylococcus pseudintermedius]|nr:ATP-binding cassette domain-containing protein [Staphylococcus pseudintermedius]